MSGSTSSPSPSRVRRKKGLVVAIVVTTVLTAGLVAVLLAGANGAAGDRAAVKRYYQTIRPHAVEGGRIVQQEIKPSLGELSSSTLSASMFARRAVTWYHAFRLIRSQFADAPRVSRLNKTAALYDEAFAGYLDAIRGFLDASKISGVAERSRAISAAVKTAEAADKRYDLARAELKEIMRVVGMRAPADL